MLSKEQIDYYTKLGERLGYKINPLCRMALFDMSAIILIKNNLFGFNYNKDENTWFQWQTRGQDWINNKSIEDQNIEQIMILEASLND